MIVERQAKREFYASVFLNGIPDVVIAAVVAWFSEGGLLVFFVVLVGLQAVYLALWLKISAWLWLRFKVRDKKLMSRRMLDILVENKFPKPVGYSTDLYLGGVATDASIDANTRVLAAGELGTLNYLLASMRVQEYMRLTGAFDAALEEYGRKFSDT